MEQKIIEYLRDAYSPRVIVLAGSRAENRADEKSDWDLFLFCEREYAGGFREWDGHLLDLTLHEWPKPKNWVFTIPYGPVWPTKVLFDTTNGEFDHILERTRALHGLGPLKAYPHKCAERIQKLARWEGKLKKHQSEVEVQFYYAGYIYEFLIRIWFEQQNYWPQPPAKALQFIQGKDRDFFELLKRFATSEGKVRALLGGMLIDKIRLISEEQKP